MPSYTYNCVGCNKPFTYTLGMNDDKPTVCEECGGTLNRDYSGIVCDRNCEKRDPNHTNYWKVGKTVSEVATVLENKQEPY
jgi:putative FmdB family regulatory protein